MCRKFHILWCVLLVGCQGPSGQEKTATHMPQSLGKALVRSLQIEREQNQIRLLNSYPSPQQALQTTQFHLYQMTEYQVQKLRNFVFHSKQHRLLNWLSQYKQYAMEGQKLATLPVANGEIKTSAIERFELVKGKGSHLVGFFSPIKAGRVVFGENRALFFSKVSATATNRPKQMTYLENFHAPTLTFTKVPSSATTTNRTSTTRDFKLLSHNDTLYLVSLVEKPNAPTPNFKIETWDTKRWRTLSNVPFKIALSPRKLPSVFHSDHTTHMAWVKNGKQPKLKAAVLEAGNWKPVSLSLPQTIESNENIVLGTPRFFEYDGQIHLLLPIQGIGIQHWTFNESTEKWSGKKLVEAREIGTTLDISPFNRELFLAFGAENLHSFKHTDNKWFSFHSRNIDERISPLRLANFSEGIYAGWVGKKGTKQTLFVEPLHERGTSLRIGALEYRVDRSLSFDWAVGPLGRVFLLFESETQLGLMGYHGDWLPIDLPQSMHQPGDSFSIAATRSAVIVGQLKAGKLLFAHAHISAFSDSKELH